MKRNIEYHQAIDHMEWSSWTVSLGIRSIDFYL